MRRNWLAAGIIAALALGPGSGAATAAPDASLSPLEVDAPPAAAGAPSAETTGRKTVSLVKELTPGPNGSYFPAWIEHAGCVFFTAFDGKRIRLYKITPSGDVRTLAPLGRGFAGEYSDPYFAVFQRELYFAGGRPGKGESHLYKRGRDGTVSLVSDVGGKLGTYPQYMTVFHNALYFVGVGADGARGLYRVTGTGRVELVHPVEPIWWGSIFVRHLNELYYMGLDPEAGAELFKVNADGKAVLAADINPHGNSYPYELTSWQNELYFNAYRPDVGFELFKLDHSGKVVLVADINPGPGREDGSYPKGSSEPGHLGGFVPYQSELYFKADAGDPVGPELHKIDRTGKVVLVADLNVAGDIDPTRVRANDGPNRYIKHLGELYFTTYGGTARGRELYKVTEDGSVELVADIDASDDYGSDPRNMTRYHGSLYFSAYRAEEGGFELFRLAPDGQVMLVEDLNPTPNFSLVVPASLRSVMPAQSVRPQFGVFRGDLYFAAVANPDVGLELYKYGPADR